MSTPGPEGLKCLLMESEVFTRARDSPGRGENSGVCKLSGSDTGFRVLG